MNKLKRSIAFLLIFALVAVCIPQIASALTSEEIQKLEELEELKRQLENVEKEIKELKNELEKLMTQLPLPWGEGLGRLNELRTKLEKAIKERGELLNKIEKKRQELADLGTPAPGTTKLTANDAEGRTWTVEALESAPDALNGADTLKIEKNAKGNYVAKLFKGGAEISSKGLLWVYQPIPAGVTAARIKVDGVETTFSVVGNTWKYAAEFKK